MPKNDAFKLCCCRRRLRVLWIAERSNQSFLKEINPEYSLEGLMLKLQYFGHPMRRAGSLEKNLMLGKIEGRKRRGWQKMRWLDNITNSLDTEYEQTLEDSEGQGSLQSMGWQRDGHNLLTEQQQQPLANTMVIQWLMGYISPLLSGSFHSIGRNGEERHHKEAESLKTISHYGMCYEGSKTKRGNKTETLECLELSGKEKAPEIRGRRSRKGTFHGAKQQGKVFINKLWMFAESSSSE